VLRQTKKDDGNFSEDSTFLLSDWLAHTPKSVIAKNFGQPERVFDVLSEKGDYTPWISVFLISLNSHHHTSPEKYIFKSALPGPLLADQKGIPPSKHRFTHRMLQQDPEEFSGGQVRIADTSNFPVSATVAAAHVILKPSALRELHWHPNADEWSYFIRKWPPRGSVFFPTRDHWLEWEQVAKLESLSSLRVAGHGPLIIKLAMVRPGLESVLRPIKTKESKTKVGVVPRNHAHYVENLSDSEPVEFLELFRAPRFQDFSLEEWLAKTPGKMVAEHLNLEGKDKDNFLAGLSKDKSPVKASKLWGFDTVCALLSVPMCHAYLHFDSGRDGI
jgi:oxalate decarboxylase/phosphoglucose isomerase-like protein (cupin superfamily)